MKFSGSNLEQAFYPVEEKIQPKRPLKHKKSKASDISIASKKSASIIKTQEKPLQRLKYFNKNSIKIKRYKKSSKESMFNSK
jgi:hypothetical protein